MKKEGLERKKTLSVMFFIFILVIVFSISNIISQAPISIGNFGGYGTTPTTAATGAAPAAPTTPQFDVKKPEEWYKYPDKAAELLKTDPKSFWNGVNGLISQTKPGFSNSKLDQLWTQMLSSKSLDITNTLKLEDKQFADLWTKLTWDNAAKTAAKLKDAGKLDDLVKKLPDEERLKFLKVAFTEKNTGGEAISSNAKDTATSIKDLQAVRKDFLLSAYKQYSTGDKNFEKTNKFFNDMWKSLQGKDGKTPDEAGIKNLITSLNDPMKGMSEVRERFAIAISHEALPDAAKSNSKDFAKGATTGPTKKKYTGLEKLDIGNSKNLALGYDKDSKELTLQYKGKDFLKLSNAQIWSNKIVADSNDGLSLTGSSTGRTLKFTGSDLGNIKGFMEFDIGSGSGGVANQDFGNVKINGMTFNPYYGDEKNVALDVKISDKNLGITSSSGQGWVRAGNNFFTKNSEQGGSFSVNLKNFGDDKNPNQVDSGKNVDVRIVLQDNYNPYDSSGKPLDPKDVKVLSLRTIGNQEVAFLNFNQKAPAGLTGYVSAENAIINSAQTPTTTKGTCGPGGCSSGSSCGPGGCPSPATPIDSLNPYAGTNLPLPGSTGINGIKITVNGVDGMEVIGNYAGTSPIKVDVSNSKNIEVSRFGANQIVEVSGGAAQKVRYENDPLGGLVINPTAAGVSSGSRFAQVLGSLGIQIAGAGTTGPGVTPGGKTQVNGQFSTGNPGNNPGTTPGSNTQNKDPVQLLGGDDSVQAPSGDPSAGAGAGSSSGTSATGTQIKYGQSESDLFSKGRLVSAQGAAGTYVPDGQGFFSSNIGQNNFGGPNIKYATGEKLNELSSGKLIPVVVSEPSWCKSCGKGANSNGIYITGSQASALYNLNIQEFPKTIYIQNGKFVR
ncbi:Uncharacterised protein [uncultured archaeon]|nr:Uncharacterised protein [uncultured archaeon]